MAKAIMIQGTSSHVGKSVLVTALCRILADKGYAVAPFKAQNMALNAYVTRDGGEIGVAQAVQAAAAGIEPHTDMNPILLKPKGERVSQVIVHGRPQGDWGGVSYRREFHATARAAVAEAWERLSRRYDVIVIEGAGSPAEINLNDRELVNMHVARLSGAPVLLVADIDRGGVFASLLGTLSLLDGEDRARVAGLIINKFRGDPALFEDGIRFLEQRSEKKVLGVIPWLSGLRLAEEDSLGGPAAGFGTASAEQIRTELWNSQETAARTADRTWQPAGGPPGIDLFVMAYPYLSNFSDLDTLSRMSGIRLHWIRDAAQWLELGRGSIQPSAILLPGSKNTLADLHYLVRRGLAIQIAAYAQQGGRVAGICGGFQMMGEWLHDPEGIEGGSERQLGLGLVPMSTEFTPEKCTRRVMARRCSLPPLQEPLWTSGWDGCCDAYEIHHGRSVMGKSRSAAYQPLAETEYGPDGAISADGRIWGTYLHGLLADAGFLKAWLKSFAPGAIAGDSGNEREDDPRSPLRPGFPEFDRLAAVVKSHLDLDALGRLLGIAL